MRTNLRLLPLPLCIALSLSAHAADERPEDWGLCPIEDAVPAFANQLPPAEPPADGADPNATDIQGDALTGTDGQTLNVQGNVILRRGEQLLYTETLVYDQQKETYVADGEVLYQDAGMRLQAQRATGNQGTDTHVLEDIKYQLVSRRGNGGADRIEMQGSRGALFGSTYSTCPPNARAWELRAQEIDVDTERGLGTARNATLRIGKVPVLYLPWFQFPIDDRRRTGLLYPGVSQSGRNGFDWRQPIYLNLAPNYDATLLPRFMSKRGLQLGAEFRYLTEDGRGTVDFAWLPSDDLTDRGRDDEILEGVPVENRRKSDRGFFRYNGYQNFGPNWQARSHLKWISDPRFLDDASNNLAGGAASYIGSDIGLYGRGRNWEVTLMADYWQLADYTLNDQFLPFHRLPRAAGRYEKSFGGVFTVGVEGEAVRFDHEERAGGTRVDVRPYVSMPLEGASWFLKPTLAWRYTAYDLERDPALPGRDRRFNRSVPIATLDAGVYFDRETSIKGDPYLHTLEPRVFMFYAPYRDQSGIPLFDTRPLTYSWGQLFRDNRYSGADRQADGQQITLAVSSRLIRESDGLERFSASLGQIRYLRDSRVTVPGELPIEQGRSAWIADASWAVNDRWNLGATYQWDPKSRSRDLATVRSRYFIGEDGIVNFAYRYRRGLTEQVDLSFLYPINPSWSLVGRYYYSLRDRELLEGIAGVQWESCCVAVRVVGRKYVSGRDGELDSAIQLEIELKGLGSAGPDTESRLRRAILGYYREDLYLVPPAEARSGRDTTAPDPAP